MTTIYKASMMMLATAAVSSAIAAPTVDGTKDASYGNALAVQTVNTGFGDQTSTTGGSELDAAYAQISGGTLYLMFTGNLETNYNHLNVFLSTGAPGVNTISGSSGLEGALNGETLATGFQASQILDFNGDGTTFYVDQASYSGGAWTDNYLGSTNYTGGNTLSGGSNTAGTLVAINNSNVLGVNGNAGTAADQTAAKAVNTGIEIAISLASLGNPSSVSVLAQINGGGNGYLSNQFLGGAVVGTGNQAGPNGVNLGNVGVTGFNVQPAPEPTTMAVLGIGALIAARRRARKA